METTEYLNASDYGELMSFLNRAFGFRDDVDGFLTFLPKLYRPEYNPCERNLAVRRNERIRAAVGLYPTKVTVAGKTLSGMAVGNMAVDPACRGEGLMSLLMRAAVREGENAACDFAFLGGQRQRYETFGFEPTGCDLSFRVTPANVRHCFGTDSPTVTLREIGTDDVTLLQAVCSLHEKQDLHAQRDPERLYDVLTSWGYRPWAILSRGVFVGYFLKKENEIRELILRDLRYFESAVSAAVAAQGEIRLVIPAREKRLAERADRFAEDCTAGAWEKFLVYRFRTTVEALLRDASAARVLDDGELSVRLRNACGGEEQFGISVRRGIPQVRDTEHPPDVDLTYPEAMSFFFSALSPKREALPPAVRCWFPLFLTVRMADHA